LGTGSPSVEYDPAGGVQAVHFANGATTTIGHDEMFRPSSYQVTRALAGNTSETFWSSGNYAYDGAGNIMAIGNQSFAYDLSLRLAEAWMLPQALTPNDVTLRKFGYGYDAFGARMYQIVASSSTTTYPYKFFTISSTTKSSTNYATSTESLFNGDTLLATVDQPFKNGAATGTVAVRYVHPDHLGSTDVVTDPNQNLVQTLSYYPYGATRIANSTSTNEKRKWIDQFADDSGLYYLNARFYNPAQGQFISVFHLSRLS
jgi:uncharacterized protein RhaS with RHS repeats